MVKRWVAASTKVTDAWITQSKQEDLFLILITLVGRGFTTEGKK